MSKFDTLYPNRDKGHEVEMVKQEAAWPQWPWLPVKRHNPQGGRPDIGVLHASTLTAPVIRFANIWDPLGKEDRGPAKYTSVEAMVDDGWVVD